MNVDLAPVAVYIVIGLVVILLIGAIIATFLFVKILFTAKRLAGKAEQTTDNVNELLKYTGKKVMPAAASAIVAAVLRASKNRTKRK